MKILIRCLFLIAAFNLSALQKVQIVPVNPTKQAENVKIYIVYPEENQIDKSSEVWVQLRLRGYPLGNRTNNDRAKEIASSQLGQSIHVVVDNNVYFARTGPSLSPFDEEGNFYEAMYRFKIPYSLSQGQHFLRVFPARSYGESLKEIGSFAATTFYVQNKRKNKEMNLSMPYITYNEPSGFLNLKEKEPVLLDFYVTNAALSEDGYSVRVSIDKKVKRKLTKWVPYYIYGLKKGKHTIRLELLDKDMKKAPGYFNDTTRSFTIS
ncbi:MAG: hypothetical protein KR126chlam6_00156 [Candidatus Anoxychlamydiales bacterium]|nr:hypothetical protein [Candidatus Anoxychlamydiales bacterium]